MTTQPAPLDPATRLYVETLCVCYVRREPDMGEERRFCLYNGDGEPMISGPLWALIRFRIGIDFTEVSLH